jgi:hypothetical protein
MARHVAAAANRVADFATGSSSDATTSSAAAESACSTSHVGLWYSVLVAE